MGGEAGVNEPFGALAGWNNPALLPSLPDHTLGQIQASWSHWDLMPGSAEYGPEHTTRALSLTLPRFIESWDMGLGAYYTRTDFGESQTIDPEGEVTGTFESSEWVGGAGLGFRWKSWLGFGANLKFYHSELGAGEEGKAIGWVGDFGLHLGPTFKTLRGLIEIKPSAAWVLQNQGQWASYGGSEYKDPPPRTFNQGYALDFRWMDCFWAHGFFQENREWLPNSRGGLAEPVTVRGFGGEFLVFGYSRTYLKDEWGKRDKMQEGMDFVLDGKRLWLTFWRMYHGDFTSSRESLLKTFPLKANSLFGVILQPNPRFVFSQVQIESSQGIMQAQKRMGFSLTY